MLAFGLELGVGVGVQEGGRSGSTTKQVNVKTPPQMLRVEIKSAKTRVCGEEALGGTRPAGPPAGP